MNKLEMKYFVLKPHGNDIFAEASRAAMRTYAYHIIDQGDNSEFAKELITWANRAYEESSTK